MVKNIPERILNASVTDVDIKLRWYDYCCAVVHNSIGINLLIFTVKSPKIPNVTEWSVDEANKNTAEENTICLSNAVNDVFLEKGLKRIIKKKIM